MFGAGWGPLSRRAVRGSGRDNEELKQWRSSCGGEPAGAYGMYNTCLYQALQARNGPPLTTQSAAVALSSAAMNRLTPECHRHKSLQACKFQFKPTSVTAAHAMSCMREPMRSQLQHPAAACQRPARCCNGGTNGDPLLVDHEGACEHAARHQLFR